MILFKKIWCGFEEQNLGIRALWLLGFGCSSVVECLPVMDRRPWVLCLALQKALPPRKRNKNKRIIQLLLVKAIILSVVQ